MVSEAEIQEALRGLYNRVGTQKKLAELAGITQSTINAYLSGKAKIENMPVGVFVKLFRNMKIDYFGEMTGNSVDDSIKKQLLHITLILITKLSYYRWPLQILETKSERKQKNEWKSNYENTSSNVYCN